ncbi:MAG: two-component system sensor histidine kinase/response regulator, partial [Phenylobacterium sp.]
DELLLTITIVDTGVGIDASKLTSIFETFTQADTSTTREFGGTGLGLSISQHLCRLMHGEISVTSELGRGSEFTCTLKLQTSEQQSLVTSELNINSKRLLIVDGNVTNLKILHAQLTALGAKVTQASSGEQALKILSDNPSDGFDGAFIDRNMPDITGDLLVKKIHQSHRELPVILMTSLAYSGDARHFAKLGFHGHFAKPVTTVDIEKAITSLFDQHQTLTTTLEPALEPQIEVVSLAKQTDPTEQKAANTVKILLVEDNLINQLVVLEQLKALELTADVCGNGIEAIEVLKNTPELYDVILMDCQMPEMDGYETTRQIRAGVVDRYRNIAIIAMTANAMKGDKALCLEAGMDDYIPKPVDPQMLIEKLNLWLRR